MTLTALVTGVTGQDGILLARRLVDEGHRVVGLRRPGPAPDVVAAYLGGVDVLEVDVRDTARVLEVLDEWRPDHVYHLAALTAVDRSWESRSLVEDVNAAAVERLLDGVLERLDHRRPRVFVASSSEVFGARPGALLRESDVRDPQSPYARAKHRSDLAAARARDEGLFVATGLLFNHESPVRPPHFVTRKITRAVAEIARGRRRDLALGNLSTARDWGAASDVVDGVHRALLADDPDDYVLATGQLHTIEELLQVAFGVVSSQADLDDPWSYVRQDPALLRPVDPPGPRGDWSHAHATLGWRPTVGFDALVTAMVEADLARVDTGVEESPEYLRAPA